MSLPHQHCWQHNTRRWIPRYDVSKLVARPKVARGPDIEDVVLTSHQRDVLARLSVWEGLFVLKHLLVLKLLLV